MSKKVKRILILVLVIAAVIGIFVLAVNLLRRGKFPGVVDAWNEMVFSKTVDDFPDRMIDNLDEQTDTNFIVYAKKVRRVTAENGTNRLVETDLEKLQYTFAAPDEQLTELKRGDVFFIEPNEYNAYGLCIKVKKVRVKDGMAVITGKDVKLADLIEYADVDMDVPVNRFYLDSSDVTEDLQVQAADTQSAAVASTPVSFAKENAAQEGVAASTLSLSASAPSASAPSASAAFAEEDIPVTGSAGQLAALEAAAIEPADKNVPFWLYELPLGEFDAKGGEVSTGINGDWGPLHAEGRAGVRINTAHVVFKVRPAMLTVLMSAEADCRAFLNGSLRAQASGSLPIRLPSIIVPVAGPLVFTYTPGVSLDFTASVGTSAELSVGAQFAAEASYMPVVNFVFRNAAFDVYNPSFTMQPVEIEGRVDLNILKGTAEFGVPYVATLYKALSGGISLEGTATAPEVFETPKAEPDSYHECYTCVDGDVYLQTRLDVGAALDLVNWFHKKRGEEPEAGGVVDFDGTPDENGETATMTEKDGKIYRFGDSDSFRISDWSWSIIDLRWPFPIEQYADFYISMRQGRELDFGWGECPHLLWRTDITAKTTDGRKVSDAVVTATDENGETRQAEVEKGKAVLYLPGGTSTLVCEKNVLRDSCEVTIDEAPTKATMTLGESRDLFIICDFYETVYSKDDHVWVYGQGGQAPQPPDTHPDVVQKIQERYPEATLLFAPEWSYYATNSHGTYSVHEHPDYSLGDVVVRVDLFQPNDLCDPYTDLCTIREPGVKFYQFEAGIVLQDSDGWLHLSSAYLSGITRTVEDTRGDAPETYSSTCSYTWVTGAGAEVDEFILSDPITDEQYQYLGVQLPQTPTKQHDIFYPLPQMSYHDYVSQQHEQISDQVADYGLELLFPYVDELWYR